jgi:SAM-dependent methyltransferase
MLYVQYGCGLCAPEQWQNFDASPTLRLQRIPLVGKFFEKDVKFPANVRYGDILKGLPGIKTGTCDGVYCSHVLEHLALDDFRKALKNTYKLLKTGGIFRCVVPDLEYAIELYCKEKKTGTAMAAHAFMQNTLLGITHRPRGINGLVRAFYGNSHHLWMWDGYSLMEELRNAGFSSVRQCSFNDCADKNFRYVEESGRFRHAVATESIK